MTAGRRFRAPAEDRNILAVPELSDVGRVLVRNRAALGDAEIEIGGVPLPDLRATARIETLAAAREYLREAGHAVPESSATSLIVTGHQPELFHPGVWVKNFALSSLAERHGALPLNLIADGDTLKSAMIRVPGYDPDPANVRLKRVPFDWTCGEIPFEERGVIDGPTWDSFPDRVASLTADWPFAPVFAAFWDSVRRHAPRTDLIGERFASARREMERGWGIRNWEVPLSRACGTAAFARFAFHILSKAGEFREAHNRRVAEYRRQHGIRSRNHPVPDLAADGDRIEVPFWAWRAGARRRRRLFVSASGSRLSLHFDDRGPVAMPDDADGFIAEWLALRDRGVRIRTRALTTTTFARLCLGDLFIHGIGGGKYDEVTDLLIAEFFAMKPPDFLVLSGTLHLPLPGFASDSEDVRRLRIEERKLYWNSQRYSPVSEDESLRALADEKRRLIAETFPNRADRRRRYYRLREINASLRSGISDVLHDVADSLGRAEREAAANAVLRRRDYPAVLYSEEQLRGWFHTIHH